jgi:hypothetical protein
VKEQVLPRACLDESETFICDAFDGAFSHGISAFL